MREPWPIIGASALSFALGVGLALWAPWRASPMGAAPVSAPAPETFALPVAAQQAWFPPVDEYDTGGETLADDRFDALLATLKERMAAEETVTNFEREAALYLHSFLRRIQIPELTPEQKENASAYFVELAGRHPDHRDLFDWMHQTLERFSVGVNGSALPFASIDIVFPWFPEADLFDTDGETFEDATVDELIAILDALLTMPETVADFRDEASLYLWQFVSRLQLGRLTNPQAARIAAYLSEIRTRHPQAGELLGQYIHQVQNLLRGCTAPNITGSDLSGAAFELNDYRGDIVVLYFSGHWCGPCHAEYPYQRFMLELFEDEPVTILGVNSDEEIETMRRAKEEEELHFRVWWDGHGETPTQGPIATAWNVSAWPTIYILDEHGVIRHTRKRHAEVITAVNELLREMRSRAREENAGGEAKETPAV